MQRKMTSRSTEADAESQSPTPSPSAGWTERIIIPTILGGIAGGGVGLVSKYRKVHGLANISATYATNLAIVTACYCGAREFVIATRKTGQDDLINSAIAGFGTGALLGRVQGGQLGALRYSVAFAAVGTAVDYATQILRPMFRNFIETKKNDDWLKLPNWSPIQILDDEALAAKQAREQEVYAQQTINKLRKEES